MQSLPKTHDSAPVAALRVLEQRAALLRKLRAFFDERGFIEVETPLLSTEVIPELHIEPIAAELRSPDKRSPQQWFLQASPELYMKRLLAAGAKNIYQVTRSFRADERGPLHNPEFTIVEWYRVGDDMAAGIDLLATLTQTLLGTSPAAQTSYAATFQQHVGVCPHSATVEELAATAAGADLAVPAGMDRANRDEWLNLLLATRVEPQLGRDRPEILYHYPASQASLAKTTRDAAGHEVAQRFELYYRGIELANGFHELTDAAEQRRRFERVNAQRVADGRPALPLPESLLAALKRGLPDCTGCALGFDRLVMLAVGAATITDVMAISLGPTQIAMV